MKYPRFNQSLRTSTLFEGVVADIASTELGIDRNGTISRSRTIGKICVSLTKGEEPAPGPRYKHDVNDVRGTRNIMAVLQNTVLHADEAMRSAANQRLMHDRVILSIRKYLQQYPVERGFLGERVGLGLLTRYAHPDMFAYPALPHHENDGDLAGHYDIGVVIKNPDDRIASYRLQNKSGCFGICATGRKSNYYESAKARYRPDIQLVSGCCHLSMGPGLESKTATAELLVKEADDLATPKEVKILDNLTDRLVFDMTANLLPRGTAGGLYFNPTSEIFNQIV